MPKINEKKLKSGIGDNEDLMPALSSSSDNQIDFDVQAYIVGEEQSQFNIYPEIDFTYSIKGKYDVEVNSSPSIEYDIDVFSDYNMKLSFDIEAFDEDNNSLGVINKQPIKNSIWHKEGKKEIFNLNNLDNMFNIDIEAYPRMAVDFDIEHYNKNNEKTRTNSYNSSISYLDGQITKQINYLFEDLSLNMDDYADAGGSGNVYWRGYVFKLSEDLVLNDVSAGATGDGFLWGIYEISQTYDPNNPENTINVTGLVQNNTAAEDGSYDLWGHAPNEPDASCQEWADSSNDTRNININASLDSGKYYVMAQGQFEGSGNHWQATNLSKQRHEDFINDESYLDYFGPVFDYNDEEHFGFRWGGTGDQEYIIHNGLNMPSGNTLNFPYMGLLFLMPVDEDQIDVDYIKVVNKSTDRQLMDIRFLNNSNTIDVDVDFDDIYNNTIDVNLFTGYYEQYNIVGYQDITIPITDLDNLEATNLKRDLSRQNPSKILYKYIDNGNNTDVGWQISNGEYTIYSTLNDEVNQNDSLIIENIGALVASRYEIINRSKYNLYTNDIQVYFNSTENENTDNINDVVYAESDIYHQSNLNGTVRYPDPKNTAPDYLHNQNNYRWIKDAVIKGADYKNGPYAQKTEITINTLDNMNIGFEHSESDTKTTYHALNNYVDTSYIGDDDTYSEVPAEDSILIESNIKDYSKEHRETSSTSFSGSVNGYRTPPRKENFKAEIVTENIDQELRTQNIVVNDNRHQFDFEQNFIPESINYEIVSLNSDVDSNINSFNYDQNIDVIFSSDYTETSIRTSEWISNPFSLPVELLEDREYIYAQEFVDIDIDKRDIFQYYIDNHNPEDVVINDIRLFIDNHQINSDITNFDDYVNLQAYIRENIDWHPLIHSGFFYIYKNRDNLINYPNFEDEHYFYSETQITELNNIISNVGYSLPNYNDFSPVSALTNDKILYRIFLNDKFSIEDIISKSRYDMDEIFYIKNNQIYFGGNYDEVFVYTEKNQSSPFYIAEQINFNPAYTDFEQGFIFISNEDYEAEFLDVYAYGKTIGENINVIIKITDAYKNPIHPSEKVNISVDGGTFNTNSYHTDISGNIYGYIKPEDNNITINTSYKGLTKSKVINHKNFIKKSKNIFIDLEIDNDYNIIIPENNTPIYFNVFDEQFNPVQGADVEVIIDGNVYSGVTNNYGEYILNISVEDGITTERVDVKANAYYKDLTNSIEQDLNVYQRS